MMTSKPEDRLRKNGVKTRKYYKWLRWSMKNQNNNHLSEEEITEDNIQKEIDEVAIRWGMELTERFQKLDWVPIAMDSEICKIYIP